MILELTDLNIVEIEKHTSWVFGPETKNARIVRDTFIGVRFAT